MKRELRALGQRADQNEDEHRDVERVRANGRTGGKHATELVAPNDLSKHQHACEQAEPSGRRDDKRHPGPVARLGALVPIPDQQERKKGWCSSQKNTSWMRLPDKTTPSIAPMKASRKEKKRGTGSAGDM